MTRLIENDTDKKEIRTQPPSSASTSCLLPTTGMQVTGLPWD